MNNVIEKWTVLMIFVIYWQTYAVSIPVCNEHSGQCHGERAQFLWFLAHTDRHILSTCLYVMNINQLYIFIVTKQSYIYSNLDVILCLLFLSINYVEIFSNTFFFMCMTLRLWWRIWSSNKKAPKNYVLSNYGSNQNKKIFIYQIENQTQCHYIPTPCYTILHLNEAAMQYPFQLCQ